jgi:hypothetical protein
MGASTRTQSGVSGGTQNPVSGRAGAARQNETAVGKLGWREDMINPNALRKLVG